MLSVYFKIFRVASDRGALMRQSPGTCRLSHHLPKAKQSNIRGNYRPQDSVVQQESRTTECEDSSLHSIEIIPKRKSTDVNSEVPSMTRRAQAAHARLQPNNLLAKAYEHYHINGPGKTARGSKEKIVYMRERKALKTIGIVVMDCTHRLHYIHKPKEPKVTKNLGFIVCWMPFFVIYLIEVFATTVNTSNVFRVINEFFLWLGYSNSVLNPIIYTMYNGDFRRCFRDLLSLGCVQHHRRTMSVKKLHQQSNMF
ncbi:unnamed protein product [Angiostrongylus costaricensis]|uniref:G_PROTEIN_RECEP_F1_2 domain-containing protein n=1 Tax=Angiostrongylus costaricensis TaxID=334426 RepID=A0A0R3PVV9_ANGCS|nr:unnamed protein product [Angiostrongylus costaricensis]